MDQIGEEPVVAESAAQVVDVAIVGDGRAIQLRKPAGAGAQALHAAGERATRIPLPNDPVERGIIKSGVAGDQQVRFGAALESPALQVVGAVAAKEQVAAGGAVEAVGAVATLEQVIAAVASEA